MKRLVMVVLGILLTAGCATAPTAIAAPVRYLDFRNAVLHFKDEPCQIKGIVDASDASIRSKVKGGLVVFKDKAKKPVRLCYVEYAEQEVVLVIDENGATGMFHPEDLTTVHPQPKPDPLPKGAVSI